MATLFIVGAGCSLGTLQDACARPPISSDFVKKMRDDWKHWKSDFPEMAKVVAHLNKTHDRKTHDSVGLEELWTCIDLHAKFSDSFPISWKARGRVVQELKAALLRMYGLPCDDLAERVDPSHPCTIVSVAEEARAGDTIVSFNYDTLIERVVRNCKKIPLRHGKCLDYASIRFAKPHGSASWSIRDLTSSITGCEPIFDSLDWQLELGRRADPLLLGAVPMKSELIFEVQEYYGTPGVFKVVREQWLTVAEAVRTATRIVVLGYSFPKEDSYGRFFFNEGTAMRDKLHPLHIDVYNRYSDSLDAVRDVFPRAYSIWFKGPVTPAKLKPPASSPTSGSGSVSH